MKRRSRRRLLVLVGTASKFQKEVLWGEEDGEVH